MSNSLTNIASIHDLRTPLNAIIGFTGTLLMRLPGPLNADQEKQLQIIQTSARQLLSLLNRFDDAGAPLADTNFPSESPMDSKAHQKRRSVKSFGRPRVLFIDDDPTSRKLMRYLLDTFGYDAIMAENGEQGLAMARRENPDLILSDVLMPGLDGVEMARRIKGDPELRSIPLVAVTALASIDHHQDDSGETFDYFLFKPIRPETLELKLSSFLAGGAIDRGPGG